MPTTTTLAELIRPALRAAGVTQRPGVIPNVDQYGEMIPEVNRMLQSWNVDGHSIFATSIVSYPLVSGQKIYTIGPGGDLSTSTPRPNFIKDANLLFPTSPVLRTPLKALDSHEWSLIQMQDINNSLPWCYFYNPTFGPSGLGTIFLAFQPPEGYSLELYTWTLLGASFSAVTDLVILPDGYDEAIVWNLAVRAAAFYYGRDGIPPLNPDVRRLAAQSLDAVQTLNTKCPALRSEAEFLGRGGNWQWSGMFAAGGTSGGTVNLQAFVISGAINGTTGSDGNPTFTLSATPSFLELFKNGINQIPNISYTLSGATITFLQPNIPVTGDLLYAIGTTSS